MDSLANATLPDMPYFVPLKYSSDRDTNEFQDNVDFIDSLLIEAVDSLFLLDQKSKLNMRLAPSMQFIPAIPPVRFLTWQDYQVSSRFGWRQHPIGGNRRLHTGIDFPQPTGTPVFATAEGVVIWVKWQPDGLGLGICIEHSTGYQSVYGHLSGVSVRAGDRVRRGVLIGKVGSSGRATGPHLHYTILYQGKPVDPSNYCFLWVKLARIARETTTGPKAQPVLQTDLTGPDRR